MNQDTGFPLHPLALLLASFTVAPWLVASAHAASDQFNWSKRIHALGGTSPGTDPVMFGEATISKPDRYEYGTTFSPNGERFFFGVDLGGRAEIQVVQWKDGKWTDSEEFLSDETASYNDPMVSADGERLYFITDEQSPGSFDIAYVELTSNGRSDVRVTPDISTPASEYFWSESLSGEQYFARNVADPAAAPDFDIFRKGAATPVAGVALSSEVNSPYYEGDPFVSADGTVLVFVSSRPGGAGKGDLYVSFRAPGGNWQTAVHLDSRINTAAHEITPYITPDGKWLLFARDGDIHWVSTSVLDELRDVDSDYE